MGWLVMMDRVRSGDVRETDWSSCVGYKTELQRQYHNTFESSFTLRIIGTIVLAGNVNVWIEIFVSLEVDYHDF